MSPVENAAAKKTILVVDDDIDQVKILTHTFELSGYATLAAYNGLSALQTVKTSMPDLIVLDVMMPGMDGLEVCEKLKANPATKHIPIIILTAKDLSKDVNNATNKNADWYVLKPYDTDALLNKVRISLSRNRKPIAPITPEKPAE